MRRDHSGVGVDVGVDGIGGAELRDWGNFLQQVGLPWARARVAERR